MGCGGSTASPNSSVASLNGPADHHNSSENLRKQLLKKKLDEDTDSLNGRRPRSRPGSRPGSRSSSICRDSGIDSAKTSDGRRHPPSDLNENNRVMQNGNYETKKEDKEGKGE